MALRRWYFLPLWTALSALPATESYGQCPVFSNTEAYQELENTLTTPHWFQCISSVTADPAPFTFNLAAQPANHSGVLIDWGDGSALQNVGNWDGASSISHEYNPDKWQTYTIRVVTNACPGGTEGILVYEPENPGADWFMATTTPVVPLLTPTRKLTSTSPSARLGASAWIGETVPLQMNSPWKTS